MNRFLALLLSLSLLLTTVGCTGRASNEPPATSGPNAAEEPVPPEEATDPPPAEEVPPERETSPEEPPVEVPQEPYVRVIDPANPMVALTFDDGPHETYTNQLLDILAEHHAVATFFEVGRNVRNYPDALPRMAELGCEIGNHSNSHKDLSQMKRSAILKDLETSDKAFVNAVGAPPTLIRPPYGAVNKSVKSATGRAVVTWTVDTMDWSSRDTDAVVKVVQDTKELDGEIVLLHSIYESTVEAVRILVPWLIEEGYQLVTVSELLAYYYGELPAANHFYGYTFFSSHGRTDTPLQLPEAPMEIQVPEDVPEEPVTPPAPPKPAPEPTPEPVPQPPTEELPPVEPEVPETEAPPAGEEEPSLPEEETPSAEDPTESELPAEGPAEATEPSAP